MKSNTTTIIILTVLIAAGGYWYFFMGSSGSQQPLTSSAPKSKNAAQTQFQALVTELSPISFNTAIFSDPKFTSLVDLATPVSPEPSGRLDPFAPVPGVTGM